MLCLTGKGKALWLLSVFAGLLHTESEKICNHRKLHGNQRSVWDTGSKVQSTQGIPPFNSHQKCLLDIGVSPFFTWFTSMFALAFVCAIGAITRHGPFGQLAFSHGSFLQGVCTIDLLIGISEFSNLFIGCKPGISCLNFLPGSSHAFKRWNP